MKKTETQKGITLIALIITIIVLLILAVAAISAVQDSEIITYANKAVTEQKKAEIREQAELIKMSLILDSKQNEDILGLKEEYLKRLEDELNGRIDGNKVIVEKDKYEIVVKNNNLDILVKEYTKNLAIKTSLTREDVVENEKIYISKITCNLEMNMTSGEYDEIRNKESANVTLDEKIQKVLDAKYEEYGETFSTIDDMVNYELNYWYGEEYESLDEWQNYIVDYSGIENPTKGNVYYFYYNWDIYDIEEKYTETELIDLLYADYYFQNAYNEYNNAKSGLTVYVIRNGIQDEEPLKENISLPSDFTFATDKNGTYEFIIKNRNNEIVAFEKININNIETERPENYLSEDNKEWKTDGNGTITAYLGSDTAITIPTYIGAEEINKISSNTFHAYSKETILEKVYIPNSIIDIGGGTFQNCINLREVKLSESITKVFSNTFENCSKLTKIVIPDSVKTIGEFVFKNCTNLNKVELPDSISLIDDATFQNCTSLSEITLPSKITRIDAYAFDYCESLTKIVIPDSVKYIGVYVFRGCKNLKEIVFSNSLETIDTAAFRECAELTEITIPDSVTTIGKYAFYNCKKLNKAIIGNSVTNIDDYAFYDCAELATIKLSNSLIRIGAYAFRGCKGITEITLPNTVTEIDANAFLVCSNLTTITFEAGENSVPEGETWGASKAVLVDLNKEQPN